MSKAVNIQNSTTLHICITANCGGRIQGAISVPKLCRFLYWILYLSLCFTSGWFALNSGVLNHYISKTTSFTQVEEISYKRPVITINLQLLPGESPELKTNIWIYYTQSYRLWPFPNVTNLTLGTNEFLIKEINKTEKVFFEQNSFYSFRIIPLTDLLEENGKAYIHITTKNAKFNSTVFVYLTSLENSVGSPLVKFKDGNYLYYKLEKNSFKKFLIKPESYNFLSQTSKCHQESYYDCLASELDKFDFNQTNCTTKCIPTIFSYGKNYSTLFCQILKDDKCSLNLFDDSAGKIDNNFTKIVDLKCKHSCTFLQYSESEINEGSYSFEPEFHDYFI